MAQRKTILTVEAISDHSCGTYQLGEIDTLPGEQVRAYIESYGEFGYSELLEFCASLMSTAQVAIRAKRAREMGNAATTV